MIVRPSWSHAMANLSNPKPATLNNQRTINEARRKRGVFAEYHATDRKEKPRGHFRQGNDFPRKLSTQSGRNGSIWRARERNKTNQFCCSMQGVSRAAAMICSPVSFDSTTQHNLFIWSKPRNIHYDTTVSYAARGATYKKSRQSERKAARLTHHACLLRVINDKAIERLNSRARHARKRIVCRMEKLPYRVLAMICSSCLGLISSLNLRDDVDLLNEALEWISAKVLPFAFFSNDIFFGFVQYRR